MTPEEARSHPLSALTSDLAPKTYSCAGDLCCVRRHRRRGPRGPTLGQPARRGRPTFVCQCLVKRASISQRGCGLRCFPLTNTGVSSGAIGSAMPASTGKSSGIPMSPARTTVSDVDLRRGRFCVRLTAFFPTLRRNDCSWGRLNRSIRSEERRVGKECLE